MPVETQKQNAARAALDYIEWDWVVGVGTGSTANHFIDALGENKARIDGAVASSETSAQRLQQHGIRVLGLDQTGDLPIYVDGADESTEHLHLIKGGGGALTREKVVAAASAKFICIADQSKLVPVLGEFPLPIEVIPMARSYVARQLVKMGGRPVYRENFVTDNGNEILDVHGLNITNPVDTEQALNQLAGVVTNGLFAIRPADALILGTDSSVDVLTKQSA